MSVSDLQLVEWKGQLFAIGGEDGEALKDTIERFDPHAQQWRVIGVKLPLPRSEFSAIVF